MPSVCSSDRHSEARDWRTLSDPNPKLSPARPAFLKVASALTLGWSDTPRARLAIRRTASSIASIILRLRSSRLSAEMPTSVLVIAPHPDDETFGCGGTISAMVRSGVLLHVAFLTDGSASHPNHPVFTPADVAALRASEARLATQVLGVAWNRVTFLGAQDGELARLCGDSLLRIVHAIAALTSRLKPEAILLPCRDDGSSEHDAAFRLVCTALEEADLRPRILEFPVWSWWNPFLILKSLGMCRKVWRVDLGNARDIKARAMASYVSQTLPIPPDTRAALPLGFESMFSGDKEFVLER
jgi:LmbE family N-acetylglucosaminyl deacetylase